MVYTEFTARHHIELTPMTDVYDEEDPEHQQYVREGGLILRKLSTSNFKKMPERWLVILKLLMGKYGWSDTMTIAIARQSLKGVEAEWFDEEGPFSCYPMLKCTLMDHFVHPELAEKRRENRSRCV